MTDERLKLTTVKILDSIYKRFKRNCIESGMNLQKFVNRSLDKYNNDKVFRDEIDIYVELQTTGSSF